METKTASDKNVAFKRYYRELTPLQEKTVNPTASKQFVVPDSGYALSKVVVNAISTQEKTVIPHTTVQTVVPSNGKYLSKVTVSAVTSEVDNNITGSNIKKGISILGIDGTMSGIGMNIEYGMTAPSDTTKLWVKTDRHISKVNVQNFSIPRSIVKSGTALPTALSDACCGAVGTKVYIFGGFNNSSPLNTIYCYDTESDTITKMKAVLPKALYRAACGVVGTKIYIFGGTIRIVDSGVTGPGYVNTIYCYDTVADTITTKSKTLPTPLGGSCCVVKDDDCYILGGYNSSNLFAEPSKSIYKYSTADDTIATLSQDLSYGIACFGGGLINSDIYFVQPGHSFSTFQPLSHIWAYDSYRVVALQSLPQALTAPVCAVVSNKLYIFSDNEVYYYDPNSKLIMQTFLPQALPYACAAAVGDKIYLFGGEKDNGELDTIYSVSTATTLPKDNLLLIPSNNGIPGKIAYSSDEQIELNIKLALLGDENNIAQAVEIYRYSDNAWTKI